MRRLLTGRGLVRNIFVLVAIWLSATAAFGQSPPSLPASFHAKTVQSPEGAEIFVRSGGKGPVVVLVHGYAENSDSWGPLAADLMKDHTVVVPDLRGIGRSSKAETGYDKKTQAKDLRAVVTTLGYDQTTVVAHDIGNMVAYAYAAMYPDKVERLVSFSRTSLPRKSPASTTRRCKLPRTKQIAHFPPKELCA
jgi:pimeloyl-ACP methyl ester carboxylesterase